MKVTTFAAKKTTGKFPNSPYNDDTFLFDSRTITDLDELFTTMCSNFTLNIPLTETVKGLRRVNVMKEYINEKLDYVVIDVDHVKTLSDQQLCLKYFRTLPYDIILGESRNPLNLKGYMRVDCNRKEAKSILRELQQHIPAEIDLTAANRMSYQAPILKHKILLRNHIDGPEGIHPKVHEDIKVPITVQVPDSIEQLCIEEFNNLGFSFIKPTENGFVCSHPSEVKTPGGFTWNRDRAFWMNHWNTNRNVSVWEKVVKTEEYRKFERKLQCDIIKETLSQTPGHEVEERYLGNNAEIVENFIANKQILEIQSPMGTGKSKIIQETLHQARRAGMRTLFITNRISLADDIAEKYHGIKHYLGTELEDNLYEEGDDLVVQIDSLWKFSTKIFDLVIIDEYTTTLLHLLTLEKHRDQTLQKFFSLKKKKLLLADAIIIKDMNIFDAPSDKKITLNNTYRDDVNLTFFSQEDNFIENLLDRAVIEPITLSSGSTRILKVVKNLAQGLGLKTFTISSESSPTEKKLILEKFSQKNADFDILMYSPTVTVGVSIETDIDTHYHYDKGLSMNVLSSVQMIKRTRSAKNINLFLQERTQYEPTNIDVILQKSEFQKMDEDGDIIGVTDIGELHSKIQRVYNILENRHLVSFMDLLTYQFVDDNYSYNDIRVSPFLRKETTKVKHQETENNIRLYKEYKSMTPDEVSDIISRPYTTTHKEEKIRDFEIIRTDSLDLNSEDLDKLQLEEIMYPGTVNAIKKHLQTPLSMTLTNDGRYTLTKNEYDQYVLIIDPDDLSEYNIKRTKHLYKIRKVPSEIIEKLRKKSSKSLSA